ncbi:MAG: glycerol-3-phosphate dehydrogenase (NAD(P)+) [Saprospiraceae bacterium]|jgi:glycerol-3-phosphate dehydrogenase (NAD(P)+)
MMDREKSIGILGAGKFGIALANLVAAKHNVILYSRRDEMVEQVNATHLYHGIALSSKIIATSSPQDICEQCELIFPVTPSKHFRSVMKLMSPFLTPRHILVHGTKGFDVLPGASEENYKIDSLKISDVKTMSEIIIEETDVKRVGALCGPNLANEILKGLPTATVIASEYNEVIRSGKEAISGKNFFVFGSYDIRAAELAGALKNVIALASGILNGRHLGRNTEAMLIVRGLREMMIIGEALGSDSKSFYGTSGLGDLIATATSRDSRNFNFGLRIANGESIDEILASSSDVVEGVRTAGIANQIVKQLKLRAPIIRSIHDVLFKNKNIEESIIDLMKYPLVHDVDFI